MSAPQIVAVVGPTAVGKSDLALSLAEALGAEIVNADSMQLYQGMDVGTAKLTEPEWRGIPHHLLDLWDVTHPASVAEYQRLARECLDDLRSRDVPAVLVGGSGLYVRAVLDDLEFPGTDAAVRARLEEELADVGAGVLHSRLAALDPAAAAGILASNGRRIVRALEVIEITGRPFTATLPGYRPHYDAVQVGIELPLPQLDARIERRVDVMWERGLVEEVRRLVGVGLRNGRTASRALGYQQVLAFLDGEMSEEEARVRTVQATRRFARRQRSWFRRDPRVTWLSGAPDEVAAEALRVVSSP